MARLYTIGSIMIALCFRVNATLNMMSQTVKPNAKFARIRRDYRLSQSDSERIQCTAFDGSMFARCPEHATFGQNDGSAPFWYHCDTHAELLRSTGSIWPSTQPVIRTESDAQ